MAITSAEFAKIKNAFSIKNFIPDVPRMLNEVFTLIYNCIMTFYNPDKNEIECTRLKAGYIDATTIVAQNLTFKGQGGELYNYQDIATILTELRQKVNSIVPITQQQLDTLDSSALIVINEI